MLKFFNFLSILLAICFFASCAGFNNPGSELILNVDNEFEIGILEVLGEDSRSIEFTITSLDKQSCQETKLDLQHKTTLNSLNINISDIILPAECGVKGSYPEGKVQFNLTEREYELQVDIQDIVQHKGILNVKDNSYELTIGSEKGLILGTGLLQRIPENFVWGYYQTSIETELSNLRTFFQNSNLEIERLTNMDAGYYSYFDIDSEGNLIIEDLPSSGNVQPFGFMNMPIAELKTKVENFKVENPNLNLNFFGADGSEF